MLENPYKKKKFEKFVPFVEVEKRRQRKERKAYMKISEELLDEENEKILSKLDDTIGLSKNKAILRDIVNYHKVMRQYECNIEFENYNIVIRNNSSYTLYEKLISVIAEIYYKNGIILEPNVLYFNPDEFRYNARRKEKSNYKDIKEGLIVLDLEELGRTPKGLKEEIDVMIEQMPNKAFIILENEFREGEVNAILTEYFSWSMKIDVISNGEKELYIKKFMDSNGLTYEEKIVKELSDNPYYLIKNKLINILVNCKMNNEKNIMKILKNVEMPENGKENTQKTGMQELDELIGLNEVKEQIKKVVSFVKASKKRNNIPMLHMCFNGNPGTGKTTVARIVGKIFAEEQILSDKKVFVEAQRCDLIGKYVGHTAPMTQRMIEKSLGGILFIDEAYSLASYIQDEGGRDYGAECIATLLKGMEDHRDNLCVILAGYTNEMQHMLGVNPGLESRIQFTIEFPDYSSEELYTIFKDLCTKEKYKVSNNVKAFLIEHFNKAKQNKNFSNARYVRNLYEKVKIEQAYRININANENENVNLIKKCDIEKVVYSLKITCEEKPQIGFSA